MNKQTINIATYIAAVILPMVFLTAQFNERNPVITFISTVAIWLGASYVATGWAKEKNALSWAGWSVLAGIIEASLLIWAV